MALRFRRAHALLNFQGPIKSGQINSDRTLDQRSCKAVEKF